MTHRTQLDELATRLSEHEMVDGVQIEALLDLAGGLAVPPA